MIRYFVYRMTFESGENPYGTVDRFREELREYFVANRLHYEMGALGGGRNIYGIIQGQGRPLNDSDREALLSWVCRKRIRATARLGSIETDEKPDLLGEPSDRVVFIDNLTDPDRQLAAEQHEAALARFREVQAARTKDRTNSDG